jgi:hypothetical protein
LTVGDGHVLEGGPGFGKEVVVVTRKACSALGKLGANLRVEAVVVVLAEAPFKRWVDEAVAGAPLSAENGQEILGKAGGPTRGGATGGDRAVVLGLVRGEGGGHFTLEEVVPADDVLGGEVSGGVLGVVEVTDTVNE